MPESLSRGWSWIQSNAGALAVVISVISGVWYLAQTLPTTADLDGLATADSLGGLASQADLEELPSQDDFASLNAQVETAVQTMNTAVSALDTAVQTMNTTVSTLGDNVADLQKTVSSLDAAATSVAGGMAATTSALTGLIDEKLPMLVRCMVALRYPTEWISVSAIVPAGADPQPTSLQPATPDHCRTLMEGP